MILTLMNKKELVDRVQFDTGSSVHTILRHLDAILTQIEQALMEGDVVSLRGLGTLKISEHQERARVNPKTLAKIRVPRSKRIKFVASKNLLKALNNTES